MLTPRETDMAKMLAAIFQTLESYHPSILQEIERNLRCVDAPSLGLALWALRQGPGSRPDHEKTKEWCLGEAKQVLGVQ